MDNDVKRVYRAFNSLTKTQKEEVIKEFDDLKKNNKINEGVRKEEGMVMGPLSGPCPCCGRG